MPKSFETTSVVHITDTTDRNAVTKIELAYDALFGKLGVEHASRSVKPALSTLDIGILASETIHVRHRPDRLLLPLNYAPADNPKGTIGNARKDFFFASLGDGIFTGGTVNGFELSYLKDRIQTLFQLTTTNSLESQFRSLEILTEYILRFSDPALREALIKDNSLVEIKDLDSVVPDLPDISHVFEIDEPFQNVKITPSKSDRALIKRIFESGEQPSAQIVFGNESIEFAKDAPPLGKDFEAVVGGTLFSVPWDTNILTLNTSSRAFGDREVPAIATVRQYPTKTPPQYKIPVIGASVKFDLAA